MKSDYDLSRLVPAVRLINNSWQNLVPFVLVAIVVALVADSQLHPAHSFFQSPPQSPVSSPPTDTPLPPTDTPTPLPTDTPVPAPPADTPTPASVANPVVESQSSEPPAAEGNTGVAIAEAVPLDQAQVTPNIPNISAANPPQNQPAPEAQATQPQPAPLVHAAPTIVIDAGPEGVEESTSKVSINKVTLIDVIVQWVASLWLCIGVGVILVIPLIFLFLQLRGTRQRR